MLADVSDLGALQAAIELSVSNAKRWRAWRDNGLKAVRSNYSWTAYVNHYLTMASGALLPRELVPDHPPLCSAYWRQASSS